MTNADLDTIERELAAAEPADFPELVHYARLLVDAHRRLLRTADELRHENARLREIETAHKKVEPFHEEGAL